MDNRHDPCKTDQVTVRQSGTEVVMSIIGDFDGSTTPAIHECCKKVQKSGRITKVVLDFAQARRVDTTAFACIINFIKEHIGTGTEICVTHLHDPEEKLIQILKVEKIIKII